MSDFSQLSTVEILARLDELDSDRQALSKALEQSRRQEQKDYAQGIIQEIRERGFDQEEIANMLLPRKKTAGARDKGSTGNYSRYVDPDDSNNVYTRGVVPAWFRNKMEALGMDPNDREQRVAFKEQHLIKE